MLIAVPSKGRAGRTTTDKIMKTSATFYVPQSEVHQYEGIVPNVVGVPNDVRGITPTRNWIMRNTDRTWIVFLDDDVMSAGYIELLERNGRHHHLRDEKFWIDEFVKFFDVTEQLGYKIWGVKTEAALRSVYPYKPLFFQSYVTASCMGIVNDGEFMFDETFKTKEDYEICLRHIVQKGGILAIRYLHWQNEHWTTEGGVNDVRTYDMEKETIRRMIRMYPGMVRSAKRKANQFCIQLRF